MFSDNYSTVYDSLNSQKDYKSESDFLLNIWQNQTSSRAPDSVLDLGCGSGQHLYHLAHIPERVGVDQSQSMLNYAQLRNPASNFFCSAIGDFRSQKRFDLIFSLFHVLSYQIEDEQLDAMFKTIRENLLPDGIAIADFWHRSAWDCNPPTTRKTVRAGDGFKVFRISEPTIDWDRGIARVDIDTFVRWSDSPQTLFTHHQEEHWMRAFTIPELEAAAKNAGLHICQVGPWPELKRDLHSSDWYGWVLMKLNERE